MTRVTFVVNDEDGTPMVLSMETDTEDLRTAVSRAKQEKTERGILQ